MKVERSEERIQKMADNVYTCNRCPGFICYGEEGDSRVRDLWPRKLKRGEGSEAPGSWKALGRQTGAQLCASRLGES